MNIRISNAAGIVISTLLVLLSLQSIVTQKEGVPPGHQVLFWVAFFVGSAILAWFAKQPLQKGVMKFVVVVTRRRVRQWL